MAFPICWHRAFILAPPCGCLISCLHIMSSYWSKFHVSCSFQFKQFEPQHKALIGLFQVRGSWRHSEAGEVVLHVQIHLTDSKYWQTLWWTIHQYIYNSGQQTLFPWCVVLQISLGGLCLMENCVILFILPDRRGRRVNWHLSRTQNVHLNSTMKKWLINYRSLRIA